MATVVVPFRGAGAKSRLGRPEIAFAMLEDVVAAGLEVGEVVVADGPGGQGQAVAAALAGLEGHILVVNADLPCVTPADLRALEAATPADGVVLVEARDGTTNALGLASPRLFHAVYGAGSAARFRALGAVRAEIPNIRDDVDTPDDLARLQDRLGPRTRAALEPVGAL
jgi:2-phospho-L-lactate guanylyltransferase (CobY/MobA/RfbA family)